MAGAARSELRSLQLALGVYAGVFAGKLAIYSLQAVKEMKSTAATRPATFWVRPWPNTCDTYGSSSTLAMRPRN